MQVYNWYKKILEKIFGKVYNLFYKEIGFGD